MPPELEPLVLWVALVAFAAACATVVTQFALKSVRGERAVIALLFAGLVLQACYFTLRWIRLGHGPFSSLFEILASNLWSLMLIFTLFYVRIPELRRLAVFAVPIFVLLLAWLILVGPFDSEIPPTYDTVWLYIHIAFGKLFLGFLLIALTIAIAIVARSLQPGFKFGVDWPSQPALDELMHRFLGGSMLFNTLMLVSGAIWAQDAWGQYWTWDPLETWALIVWVLQGITLHVHRTMQQSELRGAILVVSIFVIGFLNFLGVPFVNQSPHKGLF